MHHCRIEKDCRIKKFSIIHINVSRLCLEIHFFSLIFVHNRDVITSNYNNKCIIYLTRLYVHVTCNFSEGEPELCNTETIPRDIVPIKF